MKEKISMIIFILVLGNILTLILVSVNYYTKPIIVKNEIMKLRMRILGALNISHTKSNEEKIFFENIDIKEKNGKKFYFSKKNDLAFEFSGAGLWGPIEGVIALMKDMQSIKGLTIIRQEETPGLGGRIAEIEYLDKFKNKKFFPELKLLPPGDAKKENEIDSITGATMTSEAFLKIINKEYKKYVSLIKGE